MGLIQIADGIPMKGILSVTVRDANGAKLRHYEIRNKITFLMADVLTELLAQRLTDPTPAYNSVFSLRVGSSNTPASRADTNLGAFVFGVQLNDVNKITALPGELNFVATLGNGDANGNTLQEAGLFSRGNALVPTPSDPPGINPGDCRMLAHQIHPPIPKTIAISVEYSWRIAFTA